MALVVLGAPGPIRPIANPSSVSGRTSRLCGVWRRPGAAAGTIKRWLLALLLAPSSTPSRSLLVPVSFVYSLLRARRQGEFCDCAPPTPRAVYSPRRVICDGSDNNSPRSLGKKTRRRTKKSKYDNRRGIWGFLSGLGPSIKELQLLSVSPRLGCARRVGLLACRAFRTCGDDNPEAGRIIANNKEDCLDEEKMTEKEGKRGTRVAEMERRGGRREKMSLPAPRQVCEAWLVSCYRYVHLGHAL